MAQLPSQFRVEGSEVDEQGRNSWGQMRFFSPRTTAGGSANSDRAN